MLATTPPRQVPHRMAIAPSFSGSEPFPVVESLSPPDGAPDTTGQYWTIQADEIEDEDVQDE